MFSPLILRPDWKILLYHQVSDYLDIKLILDEFMAGKTPQCGNETTYIYVKGY